MQPLHEAITYGPVRSRRLRQSLGINILPRQQKICTFNCSYCQYGWTRNYPGGAVAAADAWPEPEAVARSVTNALERLQAQKAVVDRLTLSGHGEPTVHPRFREVVEAVLRVRDHLAPGVRVAVLSNSSTLDNPDVRGGLARVDDRYMKLDAGDSALMRRVNAATITVEKIIEGLKLLPPFVVQSMFVRDRQGRIDNTGDLAVASWIAAVSSVRPIAVHIYTIDRPPAWPYLQAAPADRLREIAQRARAAGLTAEAFAPPGSSVISTNRRSAPGDTRSAQR